VTAKHVSVAVGAALLLALPLMLGPYATTLATEIALLAVFATGVNVLLGTTGLVSLGHATFLGIGGYVYAVTSKFLGWPAPAAGMMALAAASLAGAMVGAICMRTRGTTFLLITLAFCQMFYGAALKLRALGGSDGMTGVARPDLQGIGLDLNAGSQFYLYAAVCAATTLWPLWRVAQSPFGSVLAGIRENEGRMSAIGYRTYWYRLGAFVLASFTAGVAGVLTVQYTYFISPEQMSWQTGAEAVLIIILGGRRHFLGPACGAIVFVLLKQALALFSDDYLLYFGLFFVAAVALLRDGVAGAVALALRKLHALTDRGASMVTHPVSRKESV